MPTREEVDLARAAIDRGFLTIQESVKCLQIQKSYNDQGQDMPLARILIEAGFLSEAQLGSLKEGLARAQALRQVGHYELISKVGAGGMGTVYRAKDQKADRVVALKILSPGHTANREYIERFVREALASGRLSHPNIVQGYGAGEAGGQYYFAMEFVDGTTVGEMLKDGRPIPEQQALDIAIQVAKALEHAEENNLIHRDIKPDNIMITQDGTAKLADLGLARVVTPGGSGEQSMFGTPYYASPEQCEGTEELDTKSDMYSFGATLFHMLAGRVPFNGETPSEIMTKHLRERRPYLKDLNVQLSHGVSKIVRMLMARDRRQRYPNMAEVTKDLTLVRMGRSPRLGKPARQDSGEYRYRSETGSWRTKPPARNKRALQIGICVAVGLLILLAGYGIYAALTDSAPPPPPPPIVNRTGSPKPTLTADRVFLQGLLQRGETMEPEAFLKELRSVPERYPGTESAKLALEKADEVLKQIEAKGREALTLLAARLDTLRSERRYQEAVSALASFPERYRVGDLPQALNKLRADILAEARQAFDRIDQDAQKLLAEKQYDQAVAAYRPVKGFGLDGLNRRADAAIKKIRAAKAEEMKRLAAIEREKQRLAALQRQEKTAREAFDRAKALAADRKLTEAAAHLRAVAAKLSVKPHQERLKRLAADLDRARKMLEAVKADRKALMGQTVNVTDRDGGTLEGSVFNATETTLTLKVKVDGAEAMRSVAWDALALSGFEALAKVLPGGQLATDERAALAMLYHLSGDTEQAKARFDAMDADPLLKAAAETRRRDLAFFEPPAAPDTD